MTEKWCPRCSKTLDVSLFHKNKARHDGLESMCKECKNKAFRDKYKTNEEFKKSTKDRCRKYHLDHPEWSKQKLRESHVRNAKKRLKRQQERIASDPEKAKKVRESARRSESRRRAIKKSTSVEFISSAELSELLSRYSNKCYICDVPLTSALLHWDHYQPLAAGGAHSIHNLRPSCSMCNVRKNSTWPVTDEFLLEIKRSVHEVRNLMTTGQTGGDA